MLNTISNEAELASLLGHEIGHVVLKHGESGFKDQRRLWDIIADEAENQSGLNVGLSDYRYDIAYANFNKNKEEKADEFGAELAAKKGYNPYALCDLFDRLSQNAKDGVFVQIGNLAGSHKSLKERAEHLRKYLTEGGYKKTKDGFFPCPYQSALSSLAVDKKYLSFTSEEQKILNEVAGYQKEIEPYRKPKRLLPIKRFTHIMGRVLDLADEHHFSKESLLLDSSYESFMQERFIQKDPLCGDFNRRLNMQLAFLVSSMTFCEINLSGSNVPLAAGIVIGTALHAPATFMGSAAVLGYALNKATQSPEKDSDFTGQKAKGITDGDVVAVDPHGNSIPLKPGQLASKSSKWRKF